MIRANFNAYGSYVTDSVTQWDKNQELTVTGLNLVSAPEVHFSNANMRSAIVRQAKMEDHIVTVKIPNSILQQALIIKAEIGVYEGATFKTVELVEIPVRPAKIPEDYTIADDEEIYSFNRLENQLANKATNADVETVNKRLDNIVANKNNTEGNSELVDMRVDADGKTHTSAGEAMRQNAIRRMIHIEDDLNNHTYNMVGIASATAANNPIADTAIVMFDRAYSSWDIQICYSFYGKTIYWRTHRKGTWSEWHEMGERDTSYYVDAGEDLNDVIPEKYLFGICSASAKNTPGTGENGMIEVIPFSSGSNVWYMQKWYDTTLDNIYVRRYRSGEWTDWKLLYRDKKPKTVVFMGDSILGNNQTETGVVNQYATLSGNICYNFAMGGTRAKNHSDAWAAFDAETICHAIVNKDFSAQEEALVSIDNEPAYFVDTINQLRAFDFNTADFLVINWGTNDWKGGNSPEEYYSALSEFIETMLTAFPNLVIIKMTPTQRFILNAENKYESGNTFVSSGITLKEFIETDKNLTEHYNLQVIDVFNIGINDFNKDHFFSAGDYTHHDVEGRKRLAEILTTKIN